MTHKQDRRSDRLDNVGDVKAAWQLTPPSETSPHRSSSPFTDGRSAGTLLVPPFQAALASRGSVLVIPLAQPRSSTTR